MTMPRTSRKLLLGLGLVFLVAAGCGEQQESTQPTSPVVVRKKIEAPQPPVVQPEKPDDQEAAETLIAEGPAEEPPVEEKPPLEQAKVEPEPQDVEPPAPEAQLAQEPTPEELAKKTASLYDPKGKLDPFQSVFVTQPQGGGAKIQTRARKRKFPLTPLQKIDLSQLKVVGIILSEAGNKALVEDPSGKGYVIGKGTYVGANFGRVHSVVRDRVIVEEEIEDFFTGQMKLQTVDLILQKNLGEL